MKNISTGKFMGLTPQEVIDSRNQYGENVILPPPKEPWWKLYLEKYEDPVIRILMIAAIIAIGAGIFDGKYVEGLGIIIAVFLATTMAFINEYKSNKEFDILNKVNDDFLVKVIRNGAYTSVPKREIVVHDIVLIEIGEEVPADGEILEAVSLQIDESKLTGESDPVDKFQKDHPLFNQEKESGYPKNLVFKGTMVGDGHGVIRITAVGAKSVIAQMAAVALEDSDEKTPLNKQLAKLSKQIGVVGLGIAGLTYLSLIIRDFTTKQLIVTNSQLYCSILLHVFVMVALIKVWMPILYDFLEWIGVDTKAPAFLDEEGLWPWLKNLLFGGAFLFLFGGAAVLFGVIPANFNSWIPGNVLTQFLEYFMIAVTIIVVAVPEGLAMSVTLSLAYSMRKMTANNNLVRKMDACETIGAATCICSDKTGTLTLGEMKVFDFEFPGVNINGTDKHWIPIIAESISCNSTANLGTSDSDKTKIIGNLTEGALLLWLINQDINYLDYRNNFLVKHQWTFSNETKMMGTYGLSSVKNKHLVHLKGAPEIVLKKCSHVHSDDGLKKIEEFLPQITASLIGFQKRGMRTIGLTYSDAQIDNHKQSIAELSDNFVWLGFFAIADPIRDDVCDAVKATKEAGINVKMVTGDNGETAIEIARQIGLYDNNQNYLHLSGPDFEKMDDGQIKGILNKLVVLSRAKPWDKLRLIRLLREVGHVVAVTGDGTNDAMALKQADVGLAMGKNGTALAKEASDVILLDDSFRSVVSAVMWGRSLYENIQRFILYQLTINVAALGVALSGPFIGIQLPLTVTQMLWINLIMDTFAALALATEPPHWSVMQRNPRDPEDYIVTKSMAKQIFGVGVFFLFVLIAFLIIIQKDNVVTEYELSLFFSSFVMLQFWNLFNARCLGVNDSAFKKLFSNKGFVAIAISIFCGQILIIQFGGSVFRTVPLSLSDWLYVIISSSFVLWIGELIRYYKRKKQK